MHRNRSRAATDKVDFHFRCQPKLSSKHGRLLRYLQSDETELPMKEMMLNATSAFWMPFAHKYFNDLLKEELQQSVDRAIYQLIMQIFYLEENFGSRGIVGWNFFKPTQEIPTLNLNSPTTGLDMEASNDLNNSSEDVAILALSGTGEWQDLDF